MISVFITEWGNWKKICAVSALYLHPKVDKLNAISIGNKKWKIVNEFVNCAVYSNPFIQFVDSLENNKKRREKYEHLKTIKNKLRTLQIIEWKQHPTVVNRENKAIHIQKNWFRNSWVKKFPWIKFKFAAKNRHKPTKVCEDSKNKPETSSH